jgi:hypothetical protein
VTLVRDQAATVRVAVLPVQGQQVRDVQLNVLNVPEGMVATVTPATVSVSISGPVPLLLRLGIQEIVASVDAAGLPAGPRLVPVQIQLPDGVRVDRLLTDQATVTLTPQ